MACQGLAGEELDDLLSCAARLKSLDPVRYAQVLALMKAYVAAYDQPDESSESFMARLEEASPRHPKSSA